MTLDRSRFRTFLNLAPEFQENFKTVISKRTTQSLQNMEIFKSFRENKPWSKLEVIAALLEYENYKEGQTIFKCGDVGDKFFVIVSGKVNVLVPRGQAEVRKREER